MDKIYYEVDQYIGMVIATYFFAIVIAMMKFGWF